MTDGPLLPLFDLTRQWSDLRADALEAFERIASSADFVLGEELARFEAEFARYCGVDHCVGVSDGTIALELALRALGVGPGSEVVTVAHTFVATVEAIAATGASPIFVDVDARTRCLDPCALQAALTDRTAAVVPVHLYGRPAAMPEIDALCAPRGVAVVEDAAQAHGAILDDRRAGATGVAGCFSFYPTKNLGAMGDGGAVVTNDEAVAALVRSYRHHGSSARDANHHEHPGGTHRLDNLQAAMLRLKLRCLDAHNRERRRLAICYRQGLAELPVSLPPEDAPGITSVYHLFVVEVQHRDRVRKHLRERGIATGVHYPTPVHLQPAWKGLGYREGSLPVTEHVASHALSLPIFPGMRDAEIARVCDELGAVLTLER